MALGLLCLSLILLGTLKIQAQDSPPALNPSPSLSKFPLQPDFQYEQFQGKWYAVGWAQNTVLSESQSKAAMRSITYKLNDDHSYNVTSDWLSNQGCVHIFDHMFPTDQPGLFTLKDMTHYEGLQSITVRVLETDYNHFAMVFFRMTVLNKLYLEHILYGRTKELNPTVKQYYREVTRSLGLPDDYITFPDPTVECTDS